VKTCGCDKKVLVRIEYVVALMELLGPLTEK
jgi:hypothetical protein